MKLLIKKNLITFYLLSVLIIDTQVLGKNNDSQHTGEDISNYFIGIVAARSDYNKEAFKHLKKVKSLKNIHYNFSLEYLRTLVLLEKFNEAFVFSKKIKDEKNMFFEEFSRESNNSD